MFVMTDIRIPCFGFFSVSGRKKYQFLFIPAFLVLIVMNTFLINAHYHRVMTLKEIKSVLLWVCPINSFMSVKLDYK